MEEKIMLLIGLQDCDLRIDVIRREKKDGPARIQKFKDGLKVIEGQLEQELRQLDVYKRERREADQGIEDMESRVEKSNTKLSNIKSNKEYQAALKEIDDLKREKSLLEDKVIEMMEEIETLEERCVATRAKVEELKEEFEKDRDEIQKELEAMDQDLEDLERERVRFCQAIDESLLRKYGFLREHREGFAVSPVIKGVCQMCHLGIPPQQFNELIRGDELMTCPNCQRIVYWGENERFQGAVKKG